MRVFQFVFITWCLGILAVQTSAEQKLPNILWITSEDNGPELGCYGDSYAKSPNLDGLAAKGCTSTAGLPLRCVRQRAPRSLAALLPAQYRSKSTCAAIRGCLSGSRCTHSICGYINPSAMLIGCAGPMNNTERGAATGAVLGGLLGAVVGHNKGRKTAEGAAIGALGGAVLGGAIGNRQDKQSGNK